MMNAPTQRKVQVLSTAVLVLACVCAGLVGHIISVHGQGPDAVASAAPPAPPPQIAPMDRARRDHPTFDCRAFTGEVRLDATARAIAELKVDDLVGQQVRARGRVMSAYPRILGLNWLHLCDAQGGDVLVVATADWAHPGDEVVVEGRLAHDKNIGGVYIFPLLIEGGALEGAGVIKDALARQRRGGINL